MSNELQQTRYDQLVRRVGGIIGPGSKVGEALSDLFPVLDVENQPPELLALAGWRTAWQSTERTSGVGNDSTSQLFNPVDSGHLVAVTQVHIRTGSATSIDIEIQNTALAAGTPGLYRDGRYGVPRRTVAVASSLDGGTTGGGLRIFAESSVPFSLRDDNGLVVLSPGTGLNIGTVAQNIALLVNYFWRERPAERSELFFA